MSAMSDEMRQVFTEVLGPMAKTVLNLENKLHKMEHTVVTLLGMIHGELGGDGEMAKIHDDIKAALADNETETSGIEAKLASLIALKGEGDAVFQDVLDSVKAQGSTLSTMSKSLDDAIAADAAASATAPVNNSGGDSPSTSAGVVEVPTPLAPTPASST